MVLILLSGGMDSICTTAICMKRFKSIKAVTIDYGQINRQELKCADQFCKKYKIKQDKIKINKTYDYIDLSDTWGINSILPFRNGIFLSLCIARLENHKTIVMGIEKDHHQDMPDTEIPFMNKYEELIRLGTNRKDIKIWSPAHDNITSMEMIREGYAMFGDDIFNTYTCYKKGNRPCGECINCISRHITIVEAGLVDKINYMNKPIVTNRVLKTCDMSMKDWHKMCNRVNDD